MFPALSKSTTPRGRLSGDVPNGRIEYFETAQQHQLLEELGLIENILSPSQRGMLRHIRTLLSINDHDSLLAFSKPAPDEVPERFQHVFAAYRTHLNDRGLAVATQRGQTNMLRTFLIGLSITDFRALSMDDVTAHIEACSSMTAQTRAGILDAIRTFTQWAAKQGFCRGDVAAAMPIIAGHKHATLPSSGYVVSEVAAMVAAAGVQSVKRDRAMMLASVLGLRAGDLRALCLADIDSRTPSSGILNPKPVNRPGYPFRKK